MDILLSSWVRIVTGLAMVAWVLFMGWMDNWWIFWGFFTFVYIVAFYEATKLIESQNQSLMIYAILLWSTTLYFKSFVLMPIFALVIYGSFIAYKNLNRKDAILFIYPVLPVFFLLALYDDYGLSSILWLVAIVAGTDTGAYFVGRIIGKRSFSPMSPKKTLEGVIGGIVIGTMIGIFFGVLGGQTVGKEVGALGGFDHIYKLIFISFITSIISIFGDLFESMLKREAGVKDSGNIFPGHGGMLDRADGFFFAVVAMYILIKGLY